MDRASVGRISRDLKLMWGRNSKQDFDGSLTACNEWRQEAEFEKQLVTNGGVARDGAIEGANDVEDFMDFDDTPRQNSSFLSSLEL